MKETKQLSELYSKSFPNLDGHYLIQFLVFLQLFNVNVQTMTFYTDISSTYLKFVLPYFVCSLS